MRGFAAFVVALVDGAQATEIAVLLLVLLALAVAFYLYDRRHPELPRPRLPPVPPASLDPDLPRRPRPYVPPQAPMSDAMFMPAGASVEAPPPDEASSPDELGLAMPPAPDGPDGEES